MITTTATKMEISLGEHDRFNIGRRDDDSFSVRITTGIDPLGNSNNPVVEVYITGVKLRHLVGSLSDLMSSWNWDVQKEYDDKLKAAKKAQQEKEKKDA